MKAPSPWHYGPSRICRSCFRERHEGECPTGPFPGWLYSDIPTRPATKPVETIHTPGRRL